MMSINSMSKFIAMKIGKELSLPVERQEIIEYGAISLLSQLLGVGLILLTASILHIVKEAVVVTVCGASLRKYSGGAHCSSPLRCGLLSVITVPLLVFLGKLICNIEPPISLIIVIGLDIIAILIFYLYAPKDSPSKPIKNKDKIRKFKIKSVVFAICIFIVSLILFYFNVGQVSVLAALGIFNQAYTLTKPGHISTELFDKALKSVLYGKEGYV